MSGKKRSKQNITQFICCGIIPSKRKADFGAKCLTTMFFSFLSATYRQTQYFVKLLYHFQLATNIGKMLELRKCNWMTEFSHWTCELIENIQCIIWCQWTKTSFEAYSKTRSLFIVISKNLLNFALTFFSAFHIWSLTHKFFSSPFYMSFQTQVGLKGRQLFG